MVSAVFLCSSARFKIHNSTLVLQRGRPGSKKSPGEEKVLVLSEEAARKLSVALEKQSEARVRLLQTRAEVVYAAARTFIGAALRGGLPAVPQEHRARGHRGRRSAQFESSPSQGLALLGFCLSALRAPSQSRASYAGHPAMEARGLQSSAVTRWPLLQARVGACGRITGPTPPLACHSVTTHVSVG